MKIIDLLRRESLSLSFEVFPPKTESNFDTVRHATEEIAKLRPSFMSVTYGAGGGTSQYTLDIARNIKERYGVPSLAHLTSAKEQQGFSAWIISPLYQLSHAPSFHSGLLPILHRQCSKHAQKSQHFSLFFKGDISQKTNSRFLRVPEFRGVW